MESLEMNNDFWANKRVFITGHTGFKGGWLTLWLQQLGAHVTGFSLPAPTGPSLFALAGIDTGMTSYIGDIRDAAALTQAMQAAQPEIVIHLAAQALVKQSYLDPAETYATNVMGTVNVLEAVRRSPQTRVLVMVSSDKCYENKGVAYAYKEMDALGGGDPYSNSKACTELVLAAYQQSFFNPAMFDVHQVCLASVRAGNVIGGGDFASDRLIPDLMRAIEGNQRIKLRQPMAIRPWQSVLDALHGYLLLAQRMYQDGLAFAGAWNFGPHTQQVQSAQWMVEALLAMWGGELRWEPAGPATFDEAAVLKLDCSKAIFALGWAAKWDLMTSLKHLVTWYKAYQQGACMRQLCLQQLALFTVGRG